MDKLARYMNAIDGSRTWDEVGPLFYEAFHPDCTFVTADGEMDLTQWSETAKGLVARGAVISDFEVRTSDGETGYYKLTLTVGDDDPVHLAAKGTFRDGQLAHVEPTDPSAYSDLISRSG